ncbi:MAG UNVERIFIED_CONTAM: ATP-binding cassette domain-containing protein [Microcystis novacekii LVE1205-3]|jgi:ABC-type glutathione transport system ATPase component
MSPFATTPTAIANVLENLSFEILPGQTVALVGRSGSGKTTISKLLIGLYPPTDGKDLDRRLRYLSTDRPQFPTTTGGSRRSRYISLRFHDSGKYQF